MSAIITETNPVEKCPTKIDPKETTKNGLVNGLVHKNKHKMSKTIENDTVEADSDVISDSKELENAENLKQMHSDSSAGEALNHVGKSSKKKAKKKKHPHKSQLDSNENINEPKSDKSSLQESTDSVKNESPTETTIQTEIDTIENDMEILPSCSKSNCVSDAISSDIGKLTIKDNININVSGPSENVAECNKLIDIVPYESELQMPMIMKIIQKDLSEPYSIYTYRYFIHNWPKLCFLAMCDGQCVGAIVCKLDLHRKVVRRGYIAMLAVDQNYRKLRIGSTLVQMAIQEMTNGDADEVVLETEVTNKPALKLYEKLGFVRDKRLFRYYLNGVDALRLKLWLR